MLKILSILFLNTSRAYFVSLTVPYLSICNIFTSWRDTRQPMLSFRTNTACFTLDTSFPSKISQQFDTTIGKQHNSQPPTILFLMLILPLPFKDQKSFSNASCSKLLRRYQVVVLRHIALLSSLSASALPVNQIRVDPSLSLKTRATSLTTLLFTGTYTTTVSPFLINHHRNENVEFIITARTGNETSARSLNWSLSYP